jgi:anti-anti-sigma factor
MTFQEIVDGEIVIFALSGKIMAFEECAPLREKLKDYLGRDKKRFIFDMAEVSWMNSEGVGLLASAVSTAGKVGGKIVLANIGEKVQRVLAVTKCDKIIKHFDSREAAIEALVVGAAD